MKKIIKLTEVDLKLIVNKVIQEQFNSKNINPKGLKFGDGGKSNPKLSNDVKILQQKLIDAGLLKTKSGVPTGYFGNLTKAALDKYNNSMVGKKEKDGDSDSSISKNISTQFINKFNINKLSTNDSTPVCKAGQENCAQFVNDFSKKINYVGNAWNAHDNESLGKKVWSSYDSLNSDIVNKIVDLYKKINSNGGGKENGRYLNDVKRLQEILIPKQVPVKLEVDDVVGIYYPNSSHHEEAFYEAGNKYFTKDKNNQIQPGQTILSGKGFGMNTHVGIVGAIKDGVPLIFHNIHGQVYSDPANNLRDNGRIAWVRRGKTWMDQFTGMF